MDDILIDSIMDIGEKMIQIYSPKNFQIHVLTLPKWKWMQFSVNPFYPEFSVLACLFVRDHGINSKLRLGTFCDVSIIHFICLL